MVFMYDMMEFLVVNTEILLIILFALLWNLQILAMVMKNVIFTMEWHCDMNVDIAIAESRK